MRIVCPACNIAYQVPDDRVSAGRVVRCARCGTDWAPIEADPATPAQAPPEPESQSDARPEAALENEPVIKPGRLMIGEDIPLPRPPLLAKPAPVSRASMLLMVAWVVSLAMVGTALVGLYVGRERVMAAWPPSIRAYAAVGLGGLASVASQPVLSERRQ